MNSQRRSWYAASDGKRSDLRCDGTRARGEEREQATLDDGTACRGEDQPSVPKEPLGWKFRAHM